MRTYIERSEKSNLYLIKRVLRYFWPYKWLILLSMICLGLVSAATAGTAYLIKPAMDEIFLNHNRTALLLVPIGYIILTLVKGLSRYVQDISMNYAGMHVLQKIRIEVFGHLISLPQGYFEKSQIGALMSHLTNDVTMMQRSMPVCINIMRQTLTMVALLCVVFYQNYQLALWAIVVMPVIFLPVRYFSRKLRKYGRRNADLSADISTLLQELLSGVRVIKAFGMEKESTQRFDEENRRILNIAMHQLRVGGLASPLMEFISSIAIALILWFGGSQVLDQTMTAGEFFSFIAALMMMYDPFKSMNGGIMELQNALAGAERIFGMMDSAAIRPESGGTEKLDGPFQSLEFDDVTFSYAPGSAPALENVSLDIKAGERVALVGPSGAGKTTFVNLIPRFYDPVSGIIRLNGRPLADYDLHDLRRYIAVVSQDAFLFNLTVGDNIRYGDPQADEERVLNAASSAYADGFIEELPEGYNTYVGERGTRLSGGQKQRITIARAILKDAPLLILDEATSALDSEAESIVQKALDNLMKNRTSFVIAHRLSTILEADRILVMDHGKVVASGKHEELLISSPLYAKLYSLQFKTDDVDSHA